MERRRFVYQDPNTGHLWIGMPGVDCDIPFEDICRKDTPSGLPYIIIDVDDIPLDAVDFWDAWEMDFSNPDGYGIGHDAWFAEQENKK
jgi:hypothetical protein